jgi:hypothetical protein
MLCPNCGGENREDYKFCGHCGAPHPGAPKVQGTVIVPETPSIQFPPQPVAAQPPLEASMPYTPTPPASPRRKSRGMIACLIIFLFMLCLVVVAVVGVALIKPEWLPFEIPFLTSRNNLIVGFPNRDGETDLYLLRLSQTQDKGVLLAENTLVTSSNIFFQRDNAFQVLAGYPYAFGAFVPGENYLLYWYTDSDGKITLGRMAVNQKTPAILYEEINENLVGVLLPNFQDLFLLEARGPEERCYLSVAGARANDILRGTRCFLSTDMSTSFSRQDDGIETTASLITLANNTEFTPLDAQENIGLIQISGDGTRLAYVDTTEASHVVLLNSQDGSTLVEAPNAYSVVDLGYAMRGSQGYYISENDDGNLELYLLSDTGATLVRTDLSIGAQLSLDGAQLIYMAGPIDGERTLFVRNVASGADVEVVRGGEMQLSVVDALNRIFVYTQNDTETTIYSANLDGSGLVSLFTGENYLLENLFLAPGQQTVFLQLWSENGSSLLATRLDKADEFMVVADWSSITPLDISADGMQLLYRGSEAADDPGSLFLAQLDTKISTTLDDDAEDISNAIFTARGDGVIYTAITGDSPNNAEVRQIGVDAANPAEVLYSNAVLVAAQWDTLNTLLVSSFNYPVQSTSYCPGAEPLTLGQTLEASLASGTRNCYRYRGAAGETVTFWTQGAGGLDTSLTFYDRQGNYISSDDDSLNGADPRLIVTLPSAAIYYLEVSSFAETSGSYNLSSISGADYYPNAENLTRGQMTEDNLTQGRRNYYRYSGAAGETITFWVQGADGLDTSITLYDSQGDYMGSDDYGLNGTDPRLIITLPADGNYYLEVSTFAEETGSYSLSSVAGASYCPGVEQVTVGTVLQGQMNENGQVIYGFSGQANDIYTFWVESTNMDPMLSLYDQEGYMLSSDDNNRDGVDPLLITTLPADGSYCLEVNTFGFETAPFSLSMVEGSVFCPGAETINVNDTVTGLVNDGRRTCYSFSATDNSVYSFIVSSPSGTDTVLELYDSTGYLLFTDDDGGGYPNPLLTFTADQTATYYIIVRGYSTTSSGDYVMNFVQGGAFCSTAQPIYLGDVVTGFVPQNVEVCYSFNGVLGQTVLFNVDSSADTVLVLYDETGYELIYNDDGGGDLNPRILTTLPSDGVYFIAIHGFGSNSGEFTLSFEEGTITNPFPIAIQLPANVRVSGSITQDDAIYLEQYEFSSYGHFYYLDGNAGQNIQIDGFADSLGSGLDPSIYLFDNSGTQVLISDDDSGTGYDSLLVYTLPYTGRYYLMIVDYASEYGTGSSYFYELLLTYR